MDGNSISSRIYLALRFVTTNNYGSLTELHTVEIIVTTAYIVSPVVTSRCRVAAYHSGLDLTLDSRTLPSLRHELRTSPN
jgi:hypothetical protein